MEKEQKKNYITNRVIVLNIISLIHKFGDLNITLF